MTLKKLIGVGLAGLAALAIAVLLIDPSLAQTAAPAAPFLQSGTRLIFKKAALESVLHPVSPTKSVAR